MIGCVATRLRLCLLVGTFVIVSGCSGSDDTVANPTTQGAPTTAADSTATVAQESSEELEDFYERRIDYELKGQFGRSWDELHPGQQAGVTRTRYEECRDQASDDLSGVELKQVETVEIYDDPIDVIGVPEKTSKAVTLKITVTDGEQDETFTDTYHAVPTEGRWRWILPGADVRAFQAGDCPT